MINYQNYFVSIDPTLQIIDPSYCGTVVVQCPGYNGVLLVATLHSPPLYLTRWLVSTITGLCGGAQDVTDTVRQHRRVGHERSNYCWNQVHVPLSHWPGGQRQERNLWCPLHQNCTRWVTDHALSHHRDDDLEQSQPDIIAHLYCNE